jgi:hypothetical protein
LLQPFRAFIEYALVDLAFLGDDACIDAFGKSPAKSTNTFSPAAWC